MNKEAFKIICNLIHKQLITYDEAQVLIEALHENQKIEVAPTTYPYTPYPYTPGTVTEPHYKPLEVYYNNSTTTGDDLEIRKINYITDSKTNI